MTYIHMGPWYEYCYCQNRARLHSDQNEPNSTPIAAKALEILGEQGCLQLTQLGNIAQLHHTCAYNPILARKR